MATCSRKERCIQRKTVPILILNEDKVEYPADKADAAVWAQCIGITFEQLRDMISSKLGWQIPPHVISHLERFVNWCIWAKIIEVKDFTPDQFQNCYNKIDWIVRHPESSYLWQQDKPEQT